MLCSYGCNQNAIGTLKNGKPCCSTSHNSCPAIKKTNANGLKVAYAEGRKDTSQFDGKRGWSKGLSLIPNEDAFVEGSKYTTLFLKARIEKDDLLEYKCAECSISSWRDKKIVLELDHINGINNDNRLENLRYLCPNCHSQTDTFRGRNKNTGVVKVTDQEILEAYKKHGNIRQSLIAVGLVPKGGNYDRVKKIIAKDVNESLEK
jgi:Zn finger protein HypA/HybF involved in hydrogenase expression